eukprot:CAMPEP_0181205816 /NCGR_PEP_ID=MMETSP1096-20121128/20683_1 /TAXON_ID=156174 ORGANISM="Chrysochromulina ericina, Strain CCMP281" /NCGR_SAMPLE_ID=MMETSP1096 /ASSEMBLY_ACC=CAM_ASM_000453 /LENGTH=123 /DNA_ID=CAMNT_0023296633 /DNA_START=183 /DNA_END=554 /DNA_ORIENTATION=-
MSHGVCNLYHARQSPSSQHLSQRTPRHALPVFNHPTHPTKSAYPHARKCQIVICQSAGTPPIWPVQSHIRSHIQSYVQSHVQSAILPPHPISALPRTADPTADPTADRGESRSRPERAGDASR